MSWTTMLKSRETSKQYIIMDQDQKVQLMK